ncbi:pleckstrin homology domain-containing family O member 2 isoform X2 [Alligator mississippiensis]|uniref:Pleckstrin-like proteiny domain-containing family O member 2 n=1 Tax=Alligator mississippiensis TaxID=8496 RepID=A0A151M940_ALLMI|nr:pleckstrin homology domain-containing family O member 2 isoform X2 [Alligator mississippiensis]KYO20991.1 pleckstrin-like proteiny domain-containing family O member 2 [Alligator mississippiensis]
MHEEGVKEEVTEKPKCALTADKAGWVKKCSGGFLGIWKDRYVLLCKTKLLVYEDEDEQKCIETVELENYDRCQELRALLKRKNRFLLIRSSGKKVHDIKFQAQNLEEKESWMKALNEGINRGKNKVFDEVKVDESLSLEHVTRGRAKLGQGRRPPTRSHLKEVAKCTSDGILRLDLDEVDNGPPDSTLPISNSANNVPPKETPKPPMPPAKPSVVPEKENADDNVADPEVKKPLSPPLPPAKKFKETTSSTDDLRSKDEESVGKEERAEGSTSSRGSKENLTELSDKGTAAAPIPPPKILSDKLKVSWDESSHDPESTEELKPSEGGSQEHLAEAVLPDTEKPPVPPKILSEKLRATMDPSQRRSLEDEDASVQESDNSKPSVEEAEDGEEAEPPPQEGEGEEGSKEASEEEEEETSLDAGTNQDNVKVSSPEKMPLGQLAKDASPLKLRCAPPGDLLPESKNAQKALVDGGSPEEAHHDLAEMEERVASEKEKTEKLLEKVLQAELNPTQDGNGPPVIAKTILSEAVEQLRQASQVLQEIKDFEELSKEPTEKEKEKRKELVTLYRRSVP